MELWTHPDEYNGTQTGAVENGQVAATRSIRRLTDRAILSLLRHWLLDAYVADYCRSLGAMRIFRRCYWIDALGGYTPKSLHVPSMPTETDSTKGKKRQKSATAAVPAALQPITALAQSLAQESRPIALQSLLLTAGSGPRRAVKEAKKASEQALSWPKEGGILASSWLESAPTLLTELEQAPAIFLLDPLGAAIFSYEDLLPLYKRTAPTELFFLIAHKQIELRLQEAHSKVGQAQALTALLRSDRWKTLASKQGDEVNKGFLKLFITSMRRHFLWSPQAIDLPVQSGPASITSLPYTLIYATRRPESLLIMNDALCHYRRNTYQQSYQGVLSEEWFAQQEQKHRDEDLLQLSREIPQQGIALRIRRWPDLRQQLLLNNFGHFTQQEYDQCMLQLIARQEVRCAWRQANGDNGTRVPGNEDTLIWR
ncbi:hypothetical protein KDA_20550 [Dictyobacter alpinus]|uniref:Uncharacterized protein n=1 Tax=Dictyobacter alpinus TaxID=2014873 RepID=A0A402B5E4_9CHLR|nr:hypothetical protein [Dictyobacter alpinus]GCE26571.1 hypothetical protein KDA_20550 [Dictyobacter alpinus]